MRQVIQFCTVNVVAIALTCWSRGLLAGGRPEIIEIGIVEREMKVGATCHRERQREGDGPRRADIGHWVRRAIT